MLAYRFACAKATDVDQPRNLAKSVTVECGLTRFMFPQFAVGNWNNELKSLAM